MELLRSMLFVPGNRPRMVEKAKTLQSDAIILDLEDAVPPAEKAATRLKVREIIDGGEFSHFKLFVRTNALSTGLLADDLAAIVAPNLFGIVLPKAEDREGMQEADRLLGQCEDRMGMARGTVKVLPIIETVRGALQVNQIPGSTDRLVGLAFGAEDFATDLGVERSREGVEGLYPRTMVALYARMYGITGVDSVFANFADLEGLELETQNAKMLGFRGKFVIHPSQLEIVNRYFTPTEAEIEYAKRVVVAFEEAEARGAASVALDGKMIDIPIVARARALLESYE